MQLRDAYPRFVAAGTQVVAIGQGSAARTREFAAQLQLPFILLADPRRAAYRAFGLDQMRLWRELRPGGLAHAIQAARRYGAGYEPDQDPRQLGGAFVVDRDGVIRFAFRQQRMGDLPPIDTLLKAAATAAAAHSDAQR